MKKRTLGDGNTEDFFIECTYCNEKFLVNGNLSNQPWELMLTICPHCGKQPIFLGLMISSMAILDKWSVENV